MIRRWWWKSQKEENTQLPVALNTRSFYRSVDKRKLWLSFYDQVGRGATTLRWKERRDNRLQQQRLRDSCRTGQHLLTCVYDFQTQCLTVCALDTQKLCCYNTEARLRFSSLEKKRDRITTLTRCAKWSRFPVDYFFRLSGLCSHNYSPSIRNYGTLKETSGEWIYK